MNVTTFSPTADIFMTASKAIVIPTNCRGANGAGLAKAAKLRWPKWDREYRAWCIEKHPDPGDVLLAEFGDCPDGIRWCIAVLTKDHWAPPSELPWIARGLVNLERVLATEPALTSIAIPALGCGVRTGQLDWNDVRPLILATAERLAARGVRVEVYPPHEERGTFCGGVIR